MIRRKALLSKLFLSVFIGGFTLLGLGTAASVFAQDDDDTTTFTVRLINVSRGNTLMTSEGTQVPVPLSPGVWVVHGSEGPLFDVGQVDRGEGLEALAEDGDPSTLASSLRRDSAIVDVGVFNTQPGLEEPGPLGPGQAYVFEFTAEPGDYFTLATMFVQSNDLFYAPDAMGIELFTESGRPITGDITQYFELWDAGTEINQEPGVGSDQAPRQSGPNTGADENGVVRLVDDNYSYPEKDEVIKVVISAK